MPEGLETRQLLSSKTITGQDVDGDQWVLRLIGPGDLRVTKQDDASGNAQTLDSASLINSIDIGGANPLTTRLVGKVKRGPSGDGKVFFGQMTEVGGRSEGTAGTNGIYAIDIPDFWLGQTSTSSTATDPSISIPDGVITLRFGGVDTTFTAPGGTPLNTNGKADTLGVSLGLPKTQGTSIIIQQSITSGQAAATATGSPTQDGVIFAVAGRLNQFQANAIQGNSAFPSSGFQGGGGTLVISNADAPTAITGQIGFVRVGGNATNFGVQVGGTVALISNFYIGGETNNVQLLAPAGSRSIGFGKGMDTVTILSHYIDSLQANRGALNSSVTVDRNVGRVTFGGDVVNTQFLSGYEQNLLNIFQTQQAPTSAPSAQDGGAITNVLIAGNVVDSVFAASVEPLNGNFGTSDDLKLPHGHISAKVNGTIDNSATTPDTPTTAFFAHQVELDHGPVVPPSVPELPFPNPGRAPGGPRVVKGLQPASQNANRVSTASAPSVKIAKATPKGPAARNGA
jgi:hypothetical protein